MVIALCITGDIEKVTGIEKVSARRNYMEIQDCIQLYNAPCFPGRHIKEVQKMAKNLVAA
jgi:hypothetical protein